MRFSNLPIELSELEHVAEEFRREHEGVFDVVLYGSVTQGKEAPNDFDFMVLLTGADESERFELAFEFKEMLIDMGFPHERLDVKAMNLEQMWDPNYLAVPGLVITGYSLIRRRPLHELMNGEGYALFILDIRGMTKNEKNKFSFALRGRDGKTGVLRDLEGRYLAPWVVLLPVEATYRFKEFLKMWKVPYELYLMFGTLYESKDWRIEEGIVRPQP